MEHNGLNISYTVYEDAIEKLGVTEATLPDRAYMSETLSGAGIGGEIEEVLIGMMSAMTTTLNFRNVCPAAVSLAEPRTHKIDLRVAQQVTDSKTGDTKVVSVKHILKLKPKKTSMGKVATASAGELSGDYATSYFKTTYNGKTVTEIDPLNFICIINGTDYLAEVRKALGK